jgi:hypothetical protein
MRRPRFTHWLLHDWRCKWLAVPTCDPYRVSDQVSEEQPTIVCHIASEASLTCTLAAGELAIATTVTVEVFDQRINATQDLGPAEIA